MHGLCMDSPPAGKPNECKVLYGFDTQDLNTTDVLDGLMQETIQDGFGCRKPLGAPGHSRPKPGFVYPLLLFCFDRSPALGGQQSQRVPTSEMFPPLGSRQTMGKRDLMLIWNEGKNPNISGQDKSSRNRHPLYFQTLSSRITAGWWVRLY